MSKTATAKTNNELHVRCPFKKDLKREAKLDGRNLSGYILWLLKTHPKREAKAPKE